MTRKREIGSVVAITWDDAWSDSGYYTVEQMAREKPFLCESVGILIRDDRSGLSIARERSVQADRPFRQVQHIPRQMVRRVEVLRK